MPPQQADKKPPAPRMSQENFPPLRQEEGVAADVADVVDDSQLGYPHDFRKYSRQEIQEVCSKMDEFAKPESFARFESEEKDVVLFRQTPHREWAPLPTPMISFASSVFDRKRSSSEEPADGFSGGRPPRKGS